MNETTNRGSTAADLTSSRTVRHPASERLDAWLGQLVVRRGSDLLLVSGVPPCIRFEGAVQAIGDAPLDGPEIEDATLPALTPNALQQYRDHQISDSSYRIAGVGRFRINL